MNPGFKCFQDSPDEVTFRAQLSGTPRATTLELLNLLVQYVSLSPFILVQGMLLRVDKNCMVPISLLNEPECNTQGGDDGLFFIIGVVAGIVGMIICVLCCFSCSLCALNICKLKRKSSCPESHESRYVKIKKCTFSISCCCCFSCLLFYLFFSLEGWNGVPELILSYSSEEIIIEYVVQYELSFSTPPFSHRRGNRESCGCKN